MESAPLIESIRVCVKICPTRKVKESSPSLLDGTVRFLDKKVENNCISVVDDKRLQILPVNRCVCDLCVRKRQNSPRTKAHSPDIIQRSFQFDHVLNHTSTQDELFDCVRENIDTLFSGISSTIVSFGPSGSGKTYMMRGEGNSENVGLVQRSVQLVFDRIRRENSDQYIVELSYIELAKNCFNNLLSPYISDSIAKKSQSSSCLSRTPERFCSPPNRSRSPLQTEHKSYYYSPGRSRSRSPGLLASPNRSRGPLYSNRSPSSARGPRGDANIPEAERSAEGGWISVDERLELHSSPNGAVFFTGPRNAPTVSQIQVTSEQEAMNAIFAGDKQLALLSKPNRRAGHLVISLHLMKIEPDAKAVPQATLQLVDLAVAGDRNDPSQPFADGGDLQFINRSMFALNEVLKRLAMNTERIGRAEIDGGIGISDNCSVDSGFPESSRPCSSAASVANSSTTSSIALHVPYMDSKLTMMLRDSLGGATRAVLVTSLKLDPAQFKQNLHTLEAVSRAGRVLKHIRSSNSGCLESPATFRAAFANSPSHKRPNILALSPEVGSRSQSNCKTHDTFKVSPQIKNPSPLLHANHSRGQDRSHCRTNIQLSELLNSPSVEDSFDRLTESLTHALENFSQNSDQKRTSNSQDNHHSSPQPGDAPLEVTASDKDRSQNPWDESVSGMHIFPSIESCDKSPDQSLPLRFRRRSQKGAGTSLGRFSSSPKAAVSQFSREELNPTKSPRLLDSNVRSPTSSPNVPQSHNVHGSSLRRSSRIEGSNDSPALSPSLRSHSRGQSRTSTSPSRFRTSPRRLSISPGRSSTSPDRISVNANSSQSPPSCDCNQRHGHTTRSLKQSDDADGSAALSPSSRTHSSGCSGISNSKLYNPEKTECSPSPLPPNIHPSSRVSPQESIRPLKDFNAESISVEDTVSYLGIANGEGTRHTIPIGHPNSPLKKSSFSIRSTPPYSPHSLNSPKTKASPNPIAGSSISQKKSGTISPIHGKQSHSSTKERPSPPRNDGTVSSPKLTYAGRIFTFEAFQSNCNEIDIQKNIKTSISGSSSVSPQKFLAHTSKSFGVHESSDRLEPREECVPIWQKKTATSLWREEDERRQKVQREKQRLSSSPINRHAKDANRSPTLDGTYPDDSSFQGGLLEKKCWESIRSGSPLATEESERAAPASLQVPMEAASIQQVGVSAALSVRSPATMLRQQRSRAPTPSKERPQSALQQISVVQIDRHADNVLLRKKVEALRSAFAHIGQKLQIAAKDPNFNSELFSQSDQMITRCIVAKSESYESEKEVVLETDSGGVRVAKEKALRKSLERECACLKDLMKLEKIVSQCVDSRDAPIAKSVMKSLMKLLETCDRLHSEITEVREQVDAKYATLLDGKERMCLLREGLLNFMCSYDCFDENNKKLLYLVSQGGERAQLLESLRDKMRQALLVEMQRQELESQLMFTRMRRVKDENEAEQQEIAEIEEERLAAAASLKKDYTEEARAGRAACMHSERTIKSLKSVRTELSLELEIIENIMVKINEEMVARTSANDIASSIEDLKALLAASPVVSPMQVNSPSVSVARNAFLAHLNSAMDLTSPYSKTGLSARATIRKKFSFDNLENTNRIESDVDRVGDMLRVDLGPASRETANEKPEFEEQSDKENRPGNTSPRPAVLPIASCSERGNPSSTKEKDGAAVERIVKPPEALQPDSTSPTPQPRNQNGNDHTDLKALEASISEGRSLLEELLIFCDSFHDS